MILVLAKVFFNLKIFKC